MPNRASLALSIGFAILVYATTAYAGSKPIEYAEDLGPTTLDVSTYPSEIQTGYERFQAKCSVCHSAARAISSPLKTQQEWNRYIKRMWQRPPCCNLCPIITKADAKLIWKFLTYDSEVRKTGPQAATWKKQRQALLAEFKIRYPEKYEERYGNAQ